MKMSASMTRFTENLIDLIEKNPIIYDTNLQNSKTDDTKSKAWNQIANQLGEDVEKCQTRWRSLRTRYRREMVKLERIMRKEKPKKEKHIWQYRGRLSFLFDHLRSRGVFSSSVVNISSEDDEETSQSVTQDSFKRRRLNHLESEVDNSERIDEWKLPTISTIVARADQFAPSENTILSSEDQKESANFRETRRNYEHNSTKTSQEVVNNYCDEKSPGNVVDEAELFGKLVAVKMRKLKHSTSCQVAILNILNEQERNEASNSS